MKKTLFIAIAFVTNFASAQISVDRTRIIFDHGSSNSQSIILKNNNSDVPLLAQSWIEDEHGTKVTGPLVATPILQRLNPNQEKQVRISIVGDGSAYPKDRETMLSYNMLGVPPKDNEQQNVVHLVMQSKLKLFYRPKGLPTYKTMNGWTEEMEVYKSGNNFTLKNPTPYHIVIHGFSSGAKQKTIEKDFVLKPFATETVNVSGLSGNNPLIYYVNDYGASKALEYQCRSQACTLLK